MEKLFIKRGKHIVLLLMFLLIGAQMYAQSQTINGVVIDSNEEGVPGVAVYDPLAIGEGILTSDDGRFSITVSKKCKELEFSCLGFKTVRLPLAKTAIVKLELDTQTIEETVVTGIYTRKAESFTGAVQSLASDELKRVGNQNVFESLKNLDPSLMVFDNLAQGSNPNSVATMQLRGASSFDLGTTDIKNTAANDPNMPLFILDGFETTAEKVQDMDMNRVESITILKDASAKAIYGSKAGNGVIVIETKSLRSEQTQVTYTGNFTVDLPDLSSYNLCNALEKLEIERRDGYYESLVANSMQLVDAYNLYNKRLKRALEGESTYWLSKPLRSGFSHKHSLGVELGSKALKAFVTFSYNDTQGAMKGSYRNVVSGDVNLSYRVKKWQFRNVMSISNMSSEESPYGNFSSYAKMNPYDNPYDDEGNLRKYFYIGLGTRSYYANPLYDATVNTRDYSGYLSFTDNIYAEYQIFKPLKIVGRFGITTQRSTSELFYPSEHSKFLTDPTREPQESVMLSRGSYEASASTFTTFSGDVSAQLNYNFAKKHDVFATAQYNISQTESNSVTHYAEGFPNSMMNDITFARQYATGKTPTGYDSINRNLGLLLTTGYSYMDRYMFDATVKASASSVFGTNNKWGTFWSAGFAWNLHHENFMSLTSSWLKMLKVRASLGSSGNQNFMTNNSLPVYKFYNNAYYNGFTGAYLTNMENPNLGWEQKMDYNVGLDFRTNAISFVFDAYIADTENLVFSRSTLPSTGYKMVSDNLGKVRNKGIEAGLTYRLWQRGASYVALLGKVAMNDNRLLKISDALRSYNEQQIKTASENGSVAPVVQYYDGMPLHSIWVVPSLGIDPISGKEIFLDRDGNKVNEWKATDLVNYGSSDPLFNGNFGVNGEVKGFGFSIICTFYGGGKLYNTTLLNKVENTGLADNLDRRIFEGRWHTPGQKAIFRNGETMPTQATSRFVQDNNVMNVSSASLYYEFPYTMVRKIKMSRLRLSLYANDVYTLSSIDIERGTSYPYARSFSFSLTATF